MSHIEKTNWFYSKHNVRARDYATHWPQFPSDYVEELEEVDPIARENLHNAQMRHKRTYDLRLHNQIYDVDLVYMIVSSKNIGQKKSTDTLDRSICCDLKAVISPLSHKESAKGAICSS